MLKSKLFLRWFATFILLGVIGGGILLYFSDRSMNAALRHSFEHNLRTNARLFQYAITPALRSGDLDRLRELTRVSGAGSLLRFTVIAETGEVLADSAEDARRMENHLGRPEVAAAFDQKYGADIRRSTVLHDYWFYVTLPAETEYGAFGKIAIRAAVPFADFSQYLLEWHKKLFIGSIITAGLLVVAAYFLSWHRAQPLAEISEGAERFAAGDFTHRISDSADEELNKLIGALKTMAEKQEQYLVESDRQRRSIAAILDSLSDGVIATDLNGNLIWFNRRADEMLKLGGTAALGKPLTEMVRQAEFFQFLQALEKNDVETDINLWCEQQAVAVHASGKMVRNDELEVFGAVAVLRDISQLRQLETVRRDFVSNASHELRSPVAVIQGYLETLHDLNDSDHEARAKFIDIAINNCRRLNALIDDLLLLGQIENAPMGGQREIKPLRPLIDSAIELCRPVNSSAKISTECAPDLAAPINARLFEQVLINLIDNALKYGRGEVAITVHQENDRVEIAIRDNGRGIHHKDQERIFERFYRVDNQHHANVPTGTGLGLAIVKHIVLNHHGTVRVESEINQGCVFIVSIPAS